MPRYINAVLAHLLPFAWRSFAVSAFAGLLGASLFLALRNQSQFHAWQLRQQSIAQSDLENIRSLLDLLPEALPPNSERSNDNPWRSAAQEAIDAIKKGELAWSGSVPSDGSNKRPLTTWSTEPDRYQRLRTTVILPERFHPSDQLTLMRRFSNREIDSLSAIDWTIAFGVMLVLYAVVNTALRIRTQRHRLLQSLDAWAQLQRSASPANGEQVEIALETLDPDVAQIVGLASNSMREKVDAIQQSAAQSSLVLSSMPVGVMAFDHQLRLLFVNRAGKELLGIAEGSHFGQALIEVIRQPVVVNLVQQVSLEPQIQEEELELPMSKSTLRLRAHPLATLAVTTTANVSSQNGVLLTISDETRLKQLENARRDFTANVSHELKTPLSAIKAYAETLLMGALEDEDACRKFIERISEQANRLDALIRDLLHLTKLQSQPEGPTLIDLDLNDVLKTCIEEHRTIGLARKITIDTSNVHSDCRVQADLESLRTIVGNLLSNAVRYNRPEGWVTVSTRLDANKVILSVADSGIGIPPEDLDRIFERFYRVEKARSQDAGGTGLGLSIVKYLAQAISAEIRVFSSLGNGSKFELSLKRSLT